MSKLFYILAVTACTAAMPAKQVEKINGFNHPESICPAMGNWYVSDIGKQLAPGAKDGDGAIVLVADGSAIANKNIVSASGKINAPKGITSFNYKDQSGGFSMLRKAIAVVDIDKVYAYELIYNSKVFYLDMSKVSGFLNDIVSLNDSILFVSATDKNCIFKINMHTKVYEKLNTPKIKGANGLCLDKEKKNLYCVGWGENNLPTGEIWKINLATMKSEKLGDDLGYLDGCGIYNNRLYFSDWVETDAKKGVIRYMDLNSHAITTLDNTEPIGGPADFCIDEAQKLLIVPAMIEGVVYKIPIGND